MVLDTEQRRRGGGHSTSARNSTIKLWWIPIFMTVVMKPRDPTGRVMGQALVSPIFWKNGME